MKNMIATLIRSAQATQTPLPGLNKTSIDCASDVYEVLKAHFETPQWRARNSKAGGATGWMHFELSVTDKMAVWERQKLGTKPEPVDPIHSQRPVKQEKFKVMKGINKQYQLIVVSRGWMYTRERPCWCIACVKDATETDHSALLDHYPVDGCECFADDPDLYTYKLRPCHKITGKNVQRALTAVVIENCNAVARNITHGNWVMFWNDGEGDDLWLGRAENNSDWEDSSGSRSAVLINDGPNAKAMRKVGVGEVTVKKGEAGVLLRWYKREGEGQGSAETTEHLKYVVSEFPPIVQNTKYMVHCDFDDAMCQMSAKESMVRYARRSAVGKEDYTNAKGVVVRSYTTNERVAQQEREKETWLMSPETYGQALVQLDQYLSARK